MHHLRNLIVDGRIKKALFLLKNQEVSALELTEKDPENNTPLHWAVKLGYSEIIQPLLNTNASASRSIKNKQGFTPYDLAKQHKLPLQLLAQLRANPMVAANTGHQADARTLAT